jgi:hypothetical protein
MVALSPPRHSHLSLSRKAKSLALFFIPLILKGRLRQEQRRFDDRQDTGFSIERGLHPKW